MIEKLEVGRYVEFQNQQEHAPGPPKGQFAAHPVKTLTLLESTGLSHGDEVAPGRMTRTFGKTRTSGFAPGAGAKQHRNFRWLSWWPGFISEVRLEAVDVLTGWMSGCWIMVYNRGGHTYVGHVGTVGGNPAAVADSLAVKACWNAWAAANQASLICGFQPNRHWEDNGEANKPAPVSANVNGVASGDHPWHGKILALVTPSRDLHTVYVYRQNQVATRYRIAGRAQIQPVDSPMTLSNI